MLFKLEHRGCEGINIRRLIATTIIGAGILVTPVMAHAAVTSTGGDQTTTVQYVEDNANYYWVEYRTEPRLHSPVVGKLSRNDKALFVQRVNNWWYEVNVGGQNVYITANPNITHVDTATIMQPAVTTTQVTKPWNVQADKVIETAKTQLGVPYWWGHQVPGVGFDCSNFTAWVYRTALGIDLSGSSLYQRYNTGTPVPLDQIRKGDLLFVATKNDPAGGGHVGIYMGNGQVIEEGGGYGDVAITTLYGNTWFGNNLVFARRVIQ